MKLDVSVDIRGAMLRINALEKQASEAAVHTINRLLPEMQEAIVAEMARTFDRPVPYTLGGTYVVKARPGKLEGRVALKDDWFSGKGIPATKYLAPSVFGGDRGEKRFEKALRAAGILLPGMFAVKGEGARTDAYGNMDRGQIVQILSFFRAFPDVGSRKNMTDKGRARLAKDNAKKGTRGVSYFALTRPRGKLPPGIYMRQTSFGYIKPVMIFVDGAPNYERKFDFHGVAERVARRRFADVYDSTLRKVVAGAR
jgi:hypothetical protein